jgi:hypothetical protein
MKSLANMSLVIVMLVLGGCSGGGGDPTVAPVEQQTQQTTPTSPGTTNPNPAPTTPGTTNPGTSPVVDPPVVIPVDPPPAPILTLAWKIDGTLRDGGTFSGTFKYDPTAVPRATNVRNLSPNASFNLTDFKITVSPTSSREVIFTPATVTQYEFCVGACIFSVSQASQRLMWTDGETTFYVAMPMPPTITTLRVPLTVAEWGPIDLFASGLDHRYGTGRFEFTLVALGSGSIQEYTEEQ